MFIAYRIRGARTDRLTQTLDPQIIAREVLVLALSFVAHAPAAAADGQALYDFREDATVVVVSVSSSK